ncbi:MAG: virulence-associated E family protein, partial [Saprospiraceae bacterium]|nr:virulence-associated E family protein [Saprospiraceae bacterium]
MGKELKVNEIEQMISEMVETRFNTVTKQVEYSEGGSEFRPMTDRMENIILRNLKNQGVKIGVHTVKNILESDFSDPYYPFVSYFGNLTNNEDGIDHIGNLADIVDVKNDKYWKEWFKKWLVGVVAGCMNSKKVNQQMLVLVGGQGIGKTTFLE